MLPTAVKDGLARHLDFVRRQHQFDLRQGAGAGSSRAEVPERGQGLGVAGSSPPLVRDAPPGGQPRHPNRPGVARAPGGEHHDDLRARSEPGPGRRLQPGRPDVLVVMHPQKTRFTAGAGVMNCRASRDNTAGEGGPVPQPTDNSRLAGDAPALATGVGLVSRHRVTRFQPYHVGRQKAASQRFS